MTVLLQGKNLEQAALDAGVSYSTAKRWHASSAFQAELARARRAAIAAALDALTSAARAAAAVQVKMLTDTTVPSAVRLRASIAILDRLTAWLELSDIDRRLTELEARHAPQD